MTGTMYFLLANCAQHGGGASGGDLISASLLSYRVLRRTSSAPHTEFIILGLELAYEKFGV